jgi:hypothetical protein
VSEKWEEFKESLAAWGGRPPVTPAGTAGRRIVARLGPPGRRFAWWRLAAAAVLLAGVALTVRHFSASRGIPAPAELPAGFQPATNDVVIWVVDPRTTVIFTLQPGRPGKGTES